MQSVYGIISTKENKENLVSFHKNISTIISNKKFQTFSSKHIGYGYEICSRASFNKEISFCDGIKILLIGDFINKAQIEERLLNVIIKFRNNRNVYNYLKNIIKRYLSRIDGISCSILVDTTNNKFCIFSDPNGMIPIYYYNDNDVFIFGTSLKYILSYSRIPRILNHKALYETFKLGFIIPPSTLIENVMMLMPGEILEFSEAVRLYESIRMENKPYDKYDIDIAADAYYNKFENAILDCTKGTQNCSLLLSGGIDSAAIAAIIKKRTNIKLKCYTIDFDPNNPIELNGAKKISSLFNIDHHVINNLSKEMISYFPKVIWFNEAPTFNGVSEYILCKEIDNQTEMVLTGDGNDLIWSIFNPFPFDFFNKNSIRFSDFYLNVRGAISDQLLDQFVLNPFDKSYTHEKVNLQYMDSGNLFKDSSYADMKLCGDCGGFNLFGKLRVEPNSFLFRFPYLDKGIVAMIEKVPDSFKLKSENNEYIRKYLFKYALEKNQILPNEIIHTKKTWMSSPNAQWLRGDLKNIFQETVLKKNSAIRNYFHMDLIHEAWSLHLRGKYDFSYLLMTFFTFELWYKIFIESKTMDFTELTFKDL